MLPLLTKQDILIVMADHGNDPEIGHNKHTRENVPLLVYQKGKSKIQLGLRRTLSDVGATVCEFFGTRKPENGTSFKCVGLSNICYTLLNKFSQDSLW